jgi:hypothetical protein
VLMYAANQKKTSSCQFDISLVCGVELDIGKISMEVESVESR